MCCLCGVKLKVARSMSERQEELVQKWGPNPGYDSTMGPTGLCTSCERAACKVKEGKPAVGWGGPKPPAWSKFSTSRIKGVRRCGSVPEGGGEASRCDVCTHVRGQGSGARGVKVETRGEEFVPRCEVTTPSPPKVTSKRGWWEECSQATGPGLLHPCTPAARKKNIVHLIEQQEKEDKEYIVGNSLSNIVKSEGKEDQVELAGVEGKKGKVKVSMGKEAPGEVTVSTFKKIEKEMDMSRNQTLRLQQIVRKDVPVERGARRKLREWDHMADDQLVLHRLDDLEEKVAAKKAQKDKKGKVIEEAVPAHNKAITRDVVAVKNVVEHFDWVVKQRGMAH